MPGQQVFMRLSARSIDDAYIAELKKLVVHQDAIDAVGKDLKIVYTPLHGTGNIPVRRVLKRAWL